MRRKERYEGKYLGELKGGDPKIHSVTSDEIFILPSQLSNVDTTGFPCLSLT